MHDVMVDLETMGLRPDAAIVSIGACRFDKEAIHETFHTPVALASCISCGLTTDQSTVDWWLKQTAEARSGWQTADAPHLYEALRSFNIWLLGLGKGEDLRVWSNGANFDEPILCSAYRALEADPPWKFYNVRCFRTVKSLFPVGDMARFGVAHNALDDAIHQVKHLQRAAAVHGFELELS